MSFRCLEREARAQPRADTCWSLERSLFARFCLSGSTGMWKSMLEEAREAVWLASVAGGLSVISVGVAVVLAAA